MCYVQIVHAGQYKDLGKGSGAVKKFLIHVFDTVILMYFGNKVAKVKWISNV